MHEFQVKVGATTTRVLIGRGLLARLNEEIEGFASSRERSLLAVDSAVVQDHGAIALASMQQGGECALVPVEASEEAKVIRTVAALWDSLREHGVARGGLVIGMGGGITGDVVGFAAATWMRGVELVLVPTTLLAMVDASIGGKTGINVPLPGGALGKNLAGSFWPARLVVCDIDTLQTLGEREFRCGLAECVKHAIIDGPDAATQLMAEIDNILARDPDALETLVARSSAIKASIVESDPRESGARALLNLGHTFGHALESRRELELMHGEAVSLGLVAACAASREMGMAGEDLGVYVGEILGRCGLPRRLPASVSRDDLRVAMGMDKKASHGRVRLVLPTELGSVKLVTEPTEAAIEAGLDAIEPG